MLYIYIYNTNYKCNIYVKFWLPSNHLRCFLGCPPMMLQVFGVERKSRQQSKCYLGSNKRSISFFGIIVESKKFKPQVDCVACHSKIEHFFRSFAHFEVLSTSAFGLLQISVRTQGKDAKLASWAAYLWYISEFKRWYLSDLSTWTLISLHVHLLENILFLFSRFFFWGLR